MNIIIPIGGIGKRFIDDGYIMPKPLIKALGKSVLSWNLENLKPDTHDTIHIVYREEFDIYNFKDVILNEFRNYKFKFIQLKNDTGGSAETVLCALDVMGENELTELTVVIDSDNFYNDDIIGICKKNNENLIFFTNDTDEKPIYSYIQINDNIVTDIKEKEKISDNACVGAYCFKTAKILRDSIKSVMVNGIKQKNEYYISSIYSHLISENVIVKSHGIENFNCLGTPNQLKSFSSDINTEKVKYRFCFDIDNTLVTYPKIAGDYSTVEPIQRVINFSNFLHSQGHTIILHTARRMKTHMGNVGRVQSDIAKVTLDSLDRFGIKYDEIYFGKPYANFYIDDLAIRASDDLEKETGFYKIHPDTRDHNRMEIFENHVIKYSDLIDGEMYYYKNIPKKLSHLFPILLEAGENFIKIEKIKGIPISFMNTNKVLSPKLLKKILDSLDVIHSEDTNINSSIDIYSNYIPKMEKRLKNYDFSNYDKFDDILANVTSELKEYTSEKRGMPGIIHGDPVFTNILIDNSDNIKFIDMRGIIGETYTIYGDINYDYSKIYQSIIGYDLILMGKDADRQYIESLKSEFYNHIRNKYPEKCEVLIKDIKTITKSLILSLIPIHDNDKCKLYYELINKI
jgi:capsule biosynthesis phosphatase